MGDIVNLRIVRKRRGRAEARAKGTEAAARSGESATEAGWRLAEADRERRRLDGHRIDPAGSEPTEDGDR